MSAHPVAAVGAEHDLRQAEAAIVDSKVRRTAELDRQITAELGMVEVGDQKLEVDLGSVTVCCRQSAIDDGHCVLPLRKPDHRGGYVSGVRSAPGRADERGPRGVVAVPLIGSAPRMRRPRGARCPPTLSREAPFQARIRGVP